ncbi:hypothetical protein CI610_03621 [invertebrate metagenome]|uniref:Uncharacterized protein n=1 Tax=invertebrate metagenome TaxID=1711999 RepID=A0A2H9T2N8_9ZZZZ
MYMYVYPNAGRTCDNLEQVYQIHVQCSYVKWRC